VSVLNSVYDARPDLQAAFPNASASVVNYTPLVDWAAAVVSQQWADPAYSMLAPYGYWYILMETYNVRPDLQTAFPDAYTDFGEYTQLVDWAADVVQGAFSDGSYFTLASYGYWYVLMATYNQRSDLQAAFSQPYTSDTDFAGLVDWAATVVSGDVTTDSAYSALAPYGYWYSLMATYNERPDLQAAFPAATSNFTTFTELVSWASDVVTGQWTDSAYDLLAPFGYWYALMATYNDRSDLQITFPDAYANLGSYSELVQWAGAVVTDAYPDGASSTLSPFGYYYDLFTVYDGRVDLLAAFPDAFTNWESQVALESWAGAVVNGTFADSSQTTLAAFGYWYVLYGWVYDQRSDIQAAFPLALTEQGSSQGLLNWADDVATGSFPDPAESTLAPYSSFY
jgi:hypothetical protein